MRSAFASVMASVSFNSAVRIASSLNRAASIVERDAFGLPLVPHPTEDRARMETDTEADKEGNQRNDDAGGAIALMS